MKTGLNGPGMISLFVVGASGFAQQKFKTNSPPRDGECRFENNEVEELKTLQVSCEDWKEEDTPLTYEVLINKNGKLVLLWYGPELRDCKVNLSIASTQLVCWASCVTILGHKCLHKNPGKVKK